MQKIQLLNVVFMQLAIVAVVVAVIAVVAVDCSGMSPTSSAAVSVLAPANLTSALLNRRRRYLIFDKGSTFVLQGNMAKALLPEMPRGFNEIHEYTLSYELPTTLEMLHALRAAGSATTKHTTTTARPAAATTAARPASDRSRQPHWQHRSSAAAHAPIAGHAAASEMNFRNWQRRQKPDNSKAPAKVWCARRKAFASVQRQPWPHGRIKRWCAPATAHAERFQRSRVHSELQIDFANDAERVFFELLGKLAEMHGYRARYCVLRTLCEAQHILAPQGYSLLHDLVRILIDAALPAAERRSAYKMATQRGSLSECARLYGPQCRVSFLQHFTEAVHGRFM